VASQKPSNPHHPSCPLHSVDVTSCGCRHHCGVHLTRTILISIAQKARSATVLQCTCKHSVCPPYILCDILSRGGKFSEDAHTQSRQAIDFPLRPCDLVEKTRVNFFPSDSM
jgi:hypothetical protein